MTTLDPRIYNITPTIDQLNAERRLFQLPVVVTMGVIMVASIFGNILVIYVYASRKMTPAALFILLLAVGDLTSSCLCIPFQMFDLSNPYKYPVPIACKIFRFLETFLNIWCGLILTCIAFDRYFKICYPLKTYTMGKARSLTFIVLAVTLLMSWPQLFLVGKRTVATPVEGVSGEDCSTQDGYFGSIYSLLFQAAISILFVICLVIFLLFYGRIFLVIWRRKRLLIGERYSFRSPSICDNVLNGVKDKNRVSLSVIRTGSDKSEENDAFSDEAVLNCHRNKYMETITEKQDGKHSNPDLNCEGEVNDSKQEEPRVRRLKFSTGSGISEKSPDSPCTPKSVRFGPIKLTSRVKIRTTRTTLIFALVTLAGVIGFLPYLIVEVLRQSGAAFQPGMGKSEDMTYEFLSKSYFLNNIANTLIYSILNHQFRKDSRIGLKRLFKC